ncbi:hypothetical protein PROFUN_04759 [Planoprotostelium fungivorum]|uniref:Uncharacterized protein n=1 Tax=Planoprotostelium fungivorum TaxID=1890364 RepID=A0A2P6NG13_9EUKA|nr:hypothetical protein PROFUN_04759 [Planoprotostelium fungivorum]
MISNIILDFNLWTKFGRCNTEFVANEQCNKSAAIDLGPNLNALLLRLRRRKKIDDHVVYGHHIRTKQFNESLFIKNDFKPKKAKFSLTFLRVFQLVNDVKCWAQHQSTRSECNIHWIERRGKMYLNWSAKKLKSPREGWKQK